MSEDTPSIIWNDDNADKTVSIIVGTVTAQSGSAFDEKKLSIRFYHTPSKISDLLYLEGFYRLLSRSFVFIHNKKNSSDHLVESVVNLLSNLSEFRYFQTHTESAESILRNIRYGLRSKKKQLTWIIESTGVADNVNDFCTKVRGLKNDRHGIWVRGYIQELNPKVVQLFDVLFAFDMSLSEYDVLRAAISVPGDIIDQMRTQYGASSGEEPLFVFMNYKRAPEAPLLTSNPIILVQDKEVTVPMDITPFIPVIVEATKFIFNEAKEYLGKRSSASGDIDDLAISLPITKDQFDSAQTNTESLAVLVSASATRADMYEIEQLLKQIELHRKVIASLETENTLRPSGRISVDIAEEKDKIGEKALRLRETLSRVYHKSE